MNIQIRKHIQLKDTR